ncbi:hypothetical protein BDF14DRAFT_1739498, partial [Spinellus fusiger]
MVCFHSILNRALLHLTYGHYTSPKECPFSCRYNGPECCPFHGKPVCEAPCPSSLNCKVTECPSECPDNCIHPNADHCCPKSGQSVCKA